MFFPINMLDRQSLWCHEMQPYEHLRSCLVAAEQLPWWGCGCREERERPRVYLRGARELSTSFSLSSTHKHRRCAEGRIPESFRTHPTLSDRSSPQGLTERNPEQDTSSGRGLAATPRLHRHSPSARSHSRGRPVSASCWGSSSVHTMRALQNLWSILQ
jgi:hypothetical protein